MFAMQRVFLWLSALLALYVSDFACATTEPLPPGDENPVPHIALLLQLKSVCHDRRCHRRRRVRPLTGRIPLPAGLTHELRVEARVEGHAAARGKVLLGSAEQIGRAHV